MWFTRGGGVKPRPKPRPKLRKYKSEVYSKEWEWVLYYDSLAFYEEIESTGQWKILKHKNGDITLELECILFGRTEWVEEKYLTIVAKPKETINNCKENKNE